uniref:Putative inositol monophosphatase 3 n=1 Tax=Corethrella appendiculata TaxID=1370023 RepID=U5ESQ0_9DIPT
MNFGGSIRINKCGVLILTILLLLLFYYMSWNKNNKNSHFGFSKNPNEINLRKLLIGSIQAAITGGVQVKAVSNEHDLHTKSKGKTKEGANDLITDADFKSHCVMFNGLRSIFPKLKIVSEEDSSNNEKCTDVKMYLDPTVLHESAVVPDEYVNIDDITVWIDPLDATQEYTEKLTEYVTTMVCIAVKGEPIIGVIHNPFTGKTTWAWTGKTMSPDLLQVKKTDEPVRNPILIVSRSHTGKVKELGQIIFGEDTSIITAGGAGYKVLQLVDAKATAYIHTTNIKKWDLCAGNAILNSIGGKMTNLRNEKITYGDSSLFVIENGLLATTSANNHDLYIKKIMIIG